LRQEIRALQQTLGVTTIMVTHDQEEALSVADRIVVMNHGVIEQVGTPMDIYREPASPFVADFVGKVNVLPAKVTAGHMHVGNLQIPVGGADREARLYLRPEDVLARPISAGDAHVFEATIEKIEFLGCLLPCACQLASAGSRTSSRCICRSTFFPSSRFRWDPPCPEAAARTSQGVLMHEGRCRQQRAPGAPADPLDRPHRPRRHGRGGAGAGGVPRAAPAGHPAAGGGRQGGRIRRAGEFHRLCPDARAAQSLWNSVWVSVVVTLITVPLAFGFAYALTRSCMPLNRCFAASP
jgi:hypothetical protein